MPNKNTKTTANKTVAKETTKAAETAKAESKPVEKPVEKAPEAPKENQGQGQENQGNPNDALKTDFQKAYELEDKRIEDAGQGAGDEAGITDQEAIKTDGTDNVNADKSLPTTEAQKGVADEIRTGEVEQPNLNKTVEERLGLKNPDDRLAEELREAKLSGTVGGDDIDSKKPDGLTVKEGEEDNRPTDITLPAGAQRAQDKKDAETAVEYHRQEAEKHKALSEMAAERVRNFDAQEQKEKSDKATPKFSW